MSSPTDAVAEPPPAQAEPVAASEPAPATQDAWEPEPTPEWEPTPQTAPEPELPTKLTWKGGPYFSFGLSPMSSLNIHGFHPGIRYDMESGVAWERGRARLWVGPNFHISQYYGRKKPGVGLDAVLTLSLKHVYARVGAGTATGIPAGVNVHDTKPMMGGVLGGGLVGRHDHIEGRIGVDYDVRMDTTGRVAQTVMIAMRISFGP